MNEKIALITGTSSGIGSAAVEFLCSDGWKVYGTVRKIEDATSLLSKFKDLFIPIIYDVRDVGGLAAIAEQLTEDVGENGLRLLINNAGIAVAGPLEGLSNDDFEKQLDINVKSVFRITNAFIPALIKSGEGIIINIGSISGLFTTPFVGAYSISKHALESMSDAYRRELLPFGVAVFCLEPGPIRTPIWTKSAGVFDKFSNTRYAPYLQRVAQISLETIKKARPVSDVIDVIEQIVNKKAHKPRYVIAASKFFYNFLRHFLPDRLIDNQIKKKIYS